MNINPTFQIIDSYSNGLNKDNIFIKHIKSNVSYRISNTNPLINHIEQLDKCIDVCNDVCKLRSDSTSYFLDPFDLPDNDFNKYQENNNKAEELSDAVKDNKELLTDLRNIKKNLQNLKHSKNPAWKPVLNQLKDQCKNITNQNKYHDDLNQPKKTNNFINQFLSNILQGTFNYALSQPNIQALNAPISAIEAWINQISSVTAVLGNNAQVHQSKADDLLRVSKAEVAQVMTSLDAAKNAVKLELHNKQQDTIKSNMEIHEMMNKIRLMWEEFWKNILRR